MKDEIEALICKGLLSEFVRDPLEKRSKPTLSIEDPRPTRGSTRDDGQ